MPVLSPHLPLKLSFFSPPHWCDKTSSIALNPNPVYDVILIGHSTRVEHFWGSTRSISIYEWCGCQVEDYMLQLDNNKIPKLSSVGTKYHDMQIIAQLPRHDLSADYCRHLKTDSQRASFDEFVHTRNTDTLDVGRVIASVPSMSVRLLTANEMRTSGQRILTKGRITASLYY